MKKLSKLSIFDECMNPELSENEMRETVGGGGYGGDNMCFFNCMAYLQEKIEGISVSPSYIAQDYYDGNGCTTDNWTGTGNSLDRDYGPEIYGSNNMPNQDAFNFFDNYFDMDGSGWTTGSDVSSFFDNGYSSSDSTGSNYVVGVFGTSERAHAVIFQSYDDGKYTYYDPTSGSTGTISADQVLYAGKVNGCK